MATYIALLGRGGDGVFTARDFAAKILSELGIKVISYGNPGHTHRGGAIYTLLVAYTNPIDEKIALYISDVEDFIVEGYKKFRVEKGENLGKNMYSVGFLFGYLFPEKEEVKEIAIEVLKENKKMAKFLEINYRSFLEGYKDGKRASKRL